MVQESAILEPGQDTIRDLIETLATKGVKGPEIHRRIRRYAESNGLRVPALRTVQHTAAKMHPPDAGARWSLATDETGEPAAVLAAIGAVIATTGGATRWVTNREAEWIVRIHKAAPSLDGWITYLAAREYLTRQRAKQDDVSDMDAFLAFRAWEGPDNALEYRRVVDRIGAPPVAFQIYLALCNDVPVSKDLRAVLEGEDQEEGNG